MSELLASFRYGLDVVLFRACLDCHDNHMCVCMYVSTEWYLETTPSTSRQK